MVKPNLPVLGPKLGKELGTVRAALASGDVRGARGRTLSGRGTRARAGGGARRAGRAGTGGRSPPATGSRWRSTRTSTRQLRQEGRVYELIHRVNSLRKESGLALADRIALKIPAVDEDLLEHAEWIKAETLAVSLHASGDDVSLAKA